MGHAELRPTNSGCVNPANLGVLMGSDRPHRGPRKVQSDPERFCANSRGVSKKEGGGEKSSGEVLRGILAALQGDSFATARTK